jgi:hypothetical protein
MSRVALSELVFKNTSPLSVDRGATVYVYERGTETQATLYAAETGGTTLAQPLTTDTGGRPEKNGTTPWVEPGSYDLKVDGTTAPWEAASGRADQTFVDSREFSALDPTGETECSAVFEEAAAQAAAEERRLHLAAGDYMLEGVTLKSNLHLQGAPGGKTRLIFPIDVVGGIMGTGTSGNVAEDIVLEDILFDGQQQQRAVSMGNALLKSYNARRWQIRRCGFINGTSYGLGIEGYPGEEDPNKRGPQEDIVIESCYFHDNGYMGGTVGVPHTGTSNSADNIDIKSSSRVLIKNIYSTGSSDKGLNTRCKSLVVINPVLEDNAIGADFNAHRPGPGELTNGPANDSRVTVVGGFSKDNIGTGAAVTSTTGQSDTHATFIGFETEGNGGNGIGTTKPPEGGSIYLYVFGGSHIENGSHGVSGLGCRELVCHGVRADGNGLNGFLAEESPSHRFLGCKANANKGEAGFRSKSSERGIMDDNSSVENVRGFYATNLIGGSISHNSAKKNAGTGIVTDGTSDEYSAVHNHLSENGTPMTLAGAKAIGAPNNGAPGSIATLASAEEVTLPVHADLIQITGTAEVKKIKEGRLGRQVVITFNSTAKLVDGSNLLLASTASGTTTAITLMATGANWQEIGRATS